MRYGAKAKQVNSRMRAFQIHIQIKVYCNIDWAMEQKQNKLILGCELSKYISKSRFTVILSEIWSKSKTYQFWDASFPNTYPNQGSLYGFRWISMDFDGFRWISMDFEGFRRISKDFEGFRWISMDFEGFRWISKDSRPPKTMKNRWKPFRNPLKSSE